MIEILLNADGDGFDLDGDTCNSILQYNYSHNNDAAGLLVCEYSGAPNANSNNIVRYNISENDCRKRAYGSIEFYNAGPGLQNCEVYNNTIFLSAPSYGSTAAVNVLAPFVIPGTIAVAQYDNGGEGFAYHDVDAVRLARQSIANQT